LQNALEKINHFFSRNEKSRVSVINFGVDARIIYERCKPKEINVNSIPFGNDGNTKFDKAFGLAYKIANEYV
jgi:uncharacterized protein YegL